MRQHDYVDQGVFLPAGGADRQAAGGWGDLEIALITHDPDLKEQRNRKLVNALAERGVSVRVLAPGRETVCISGSGTAFIDGSGRELNPDLVVNGLYRNSGWGLDLVRAFELAGYPVVNRAEAWYRAKMKHVASAALAAAGVPQPPVVFSHGVPAPLWRRARRLGRRVVLKPWNSALGEGSARYPQAQITRERLGRWRRRHGSVYAQAYVPNPGRDIRVVVVGSEALGASYRYARRGMWKTNVAAGGRPAYCRLTEPLRRLALAATRAVGLDVAGVDIIEGAERLQVLELNAWPNYHGYDQIARVDVAGYLADYLIERARRGTG